jgi:hypothetical protein
MHYETFFLQAQRRIQAIHNYLQQILGSNGSTNPPPYTTPGIVKLKGQNGHPAWPKKLYDTCPAYSLESRNF